MNKVIITGRIVKDIELRKSDSGKSVVSNSLAVERTIKDDKGKYIVDFIPFVVWNDPAEILEKYSKKGSKILLQGKWQIRDYVDKEGLPRKQNECLVDNLELLDPAPKKEDKVEKKEERKEEYDTIGFEITDDELPF